MYSINPRLPMDSSTGYYYFIKIAVALLVALFSTLIIDMMINGAQVGDENPSYWSFLIGVLPLTVVSVIAWRMGIVHCTDGMMIVTHHGKQQAFKWHEVSSIIQVPCCTPPIYRISFKSGFPAVYVIARFKVLLSIGFWSWDFSGLRKYVQGRINAAAAIHPSQMLEPQRQRAVQFNKSVSTTFITPAAPAPET